MHNLSLAVLVHSLCLVNVWIFWCECAQSFSLAVMLTPFVPLCIYFMNLFFEHEHNLRPQYILHQNDEQRDHLSGMNMH